MNTDKKKKSGTPWRFGMAAFTVVLLVGLLTTFAISFAAVLLRNSTQGLHERFYSRLYEQFQRADISMDIAKAAGSSDELATVMAHYSGQFGIDGEHRKYYILGGKYGEVLARTSGVGDTIPITLNILEAILGREGFEVDRFQEYVDVAMPIGEYIIYVWDDKYEIYERMRENRTAVIQGALVSLILTFLGGLYIYYVKFIRPLKNLGAGMNRFKTGELTIPLKPEGNNEVSDLVPIFNDLMENVRKSQAEKEAEQERKEAEHLRTEQQQRDFVADVSHELKTPITSVRSYAETLVAEDDELDPETRKYFLNVILNESDRMTKLVQDLLVLFKFDAGEIPFSFETFDLTEAVRRVYEAMALEAEKHGLSVTLDCGTEPLLCYGDRDRIEQVLMNVVSNAVRYTPEGGRIEISAYSGMSTLVAAVRDSGIGIPESDMPRLFDRFYRVDKARARANGGSGLGLAIAKEIVERHKGTIEIESEVGVGTTMRVRLPAASAIDTRENMEAVNA
ncbi:MAG: HAMP domain-containing protein [Oscillospiraceae bacterium]|jgi:signal transduction histidine kinase|nr:HAMP domain-containing protein [Oscillospiraceae bacterium]